MCREPVVASLESLRSLVEGRVPPYAAIAALGTRLCPDERLWPGMTAVRHTGIVVADLDHVLGFWCEVLGFRVDRRMEEFGSDLDAVLGLEGVRVTTVKLAAPNGGLIELLRFHSHPDKPKWSGTAFSTGLTHVALTVDDIEEVCARMDEYGYEPEPWHRSPDGQVKMTYCRGPEGLLVELVEEASE